MAMGTLYSDIRKSSVCSPAVGSATAKTSAGRFVSFHLSPVVCATLRLGDCLEDFNPFTAMLISWAILFIVVILALFVSLRSIFSRQYFLF